MQSTVFPSHHACLKGVMAVLKKPAVEFSSSTSTLPFLTRSMSASVMVVVR